MINAISSWAKSIILAVIIATILEMILPEGNNKKYIKTVIGIYILFTIISPIFSKINGGKFNIDTSKYEKYINTKVQSANSKAIDVNVNNTYESNIKSDIKQKLKGKGYIVKQIDIDIEMKDKEKYGSIKSLKLLLDKKENNNINNIKKVKINIKNENNNDSKSNLNLLEKAELKKFLYETYNISENNIDIGG